jgi:hypothetical protein
MKDICRQRLDAVRASQGRRPMTDAEAAAIDAALSGAATRLARTDPNWRSYTFDQRTMRAGEEAQAELQRQAARKVRFAELQIIKTDETARRIADQMQRMGFTRAQAWADDIQLTSDMSHALVKEYAADLMDALTAAESTNGASLPRAIGMRTLGVDNPVMTRDIAREIHDHGKAGSGNRLAVAASQAFERVNEAMRQRFNAAGGDVGRLGYGYMPNAWDPELILSAGPERFAQRMLDKVDRSQYLRADGLRMSDDEVLIFLRAAAETLATNGANHASPGVFKGSKATANHGQEHRSIHWKSGDAYLEAMSEFGTGSMYDALLGHLNGMARDITLVERYGPNPTAMHRMQAELAAQASGSGKAPLVAWSSLDHHWAALVGTPVARWEYTPPVVGDALEAVTMGAVSGRFTGAGAARLWQHVRNAQTFGKLQSVLLSSFTDLPTYFLTTGFNKLSYWEAFANLPRSMTPVARRELVEFMNAQGLMADTMISSLNRFTGDNLAASWSARLANKTMWLGLNNWWQDGLRRSFALTLQQGVARWLGKGWSDLDEWTREILLARRGITADDWEVMRSADLVSTKWGEILTPQAIYATGHPRAAEVAQRYLAVLSHEQQMAAIEGDVAARAFVQRGTAPGSLTGEGARLIAQFKSFPIAMITRHWRRMLETPGGLEGAPLGYQSESAVNRLAYFGAFMVAMTAMGAISFQSKQIKEGKDPIDMTTSKFWLRALAQGGGLGFLGDVALRDSTDDRTPQQGLFELMGPTFASGAQLYELTKGNLDELAAGKDTHAGAEAIQFARSHAPLVNLWYAKAALDHAALHALQENLSPGYLGRMRQRAHKEWGQEFWWTPGDGGPQRAPSFESVAGGLR